MGEEDVVAKARRILADMPLCDRCLGRLFALLGYGWSNKERGDAIKRVIVMELHKKYRVTGTLSEEDFKVLANIGGQALPLLRLIAPERVEGRLAEGRRCAICSGELDDTIERAAREGLKLLRAYDIRKFVVGAKVGEDVLRVEEELKLRYGLAFSESLKAELRREVGKLIQKLDPSVRADFEEPEATLLVSFPGGNIDIQVNSLFLAGRYWKLGRLISQAYWPSPTGPRYFSVEQAAWGLLRLTSGERLVVHAAGREDVDARMLGTGRPLIVEIKAPRRRHLPLEEFERHANADSKGLVEFRFERVARRRDVRLYKEESVKLRKTYKTLIVSLEGPLSDADLERLEREFTGRRVLQRTPRRVLHRRPDMTRTRTVYEVKCRRLLGEIAECLVLAEGGLYIKELVDGDAGRTTPSFSEVLGKALQCVELDVIGVESPLDLGAEHAGAT